MPFGVISHISVPTSMTPGPPERENEDSGMICPLATGSPAAVYPFPVNGTGAVNSEGPPRAIESNGMTGCDEPASSVNLSS